MTMKVFSTDAHREKKSCLQAFILQSERLSEIHFMAIERPKFQKLFLPCPPWGYFMETVN